MNARKASSWVGCTGRDGLVLRADAELCDCATEDCGSLQGGFKKHGRAGGAAQMPESLDAAEAAPLMCAALTRQPLAT